MMGTCVPVWSCTGAPPPPPGGVDRAAHDAEVPTWDTERGRAGLGGTPSLPTHRTGTLRRHHCRQNARPVRLLQRPPHGLAGGVPYYFLRSEPTKSQFETARCLRTGPPCTRERPPLCWLPRGPPTLQQEHGELQLVNCPGQCVLQQLKALTLLTPGPHYRD